MTLQADTSVLDSAPCLTDDLNNELIMMMMISMGAFLWVMLTLDLLSGKFYANNQSGNVEGVTATHLGKTSTPVKWCGHTRKSKTANEENIVRFANKEFTYTEE